MVHRTPCLGTRQAQLSHQPKLQRPWTALNSRSQLIGAMVCVQSPSFDVIGAGTTLPAKLGKARYAASSLPLVNPVNKVEPTPTPLQENKSYKQQGKAELAALQRNKGRIDTHQYCLFSPCTLSNQGEASISSPCDPSAFCLYPRHYRPGPLPLNLLIETLICGGKTIDLPFLSPPASQLSLSLSTPNILTALVFPANNLPPRQKTPFGAHVA